MSLAGGVKDTINHLKASPCYLRLQILKMGLRPMTLTFPLLMGASRQPSDPPFDRQVPTLGPLSQGLSLDVVILRDGVPPPACALRGPTWPP